MKSFNDIVTEFFKVPASDVKPELSSKDIPEWDSMNYLLFIAELEKEFNVSFAMDEVLSVQSLGDIMKSLKEKGVAI